MSIGAKHWALAQTVEGGSSPRIVLFFLADWIIGDDQIECWPSVETLNDTRVEPPRGQFRTGV